MCCRSAYEGKLCPLSSCNFYHFPVHLSTVPAATKTKLQAWVATQTSVKWATASETWDTATSSSSAGN